MIFDNLDLLMFHAYNNIFIILTFKQQKKIGNIINNENQTIILYFYNCYFYVNMK